MILTNAEKNRIKELHNKKGRREQELFIAEGVALLEESIRFKRKPEKVYFSQTLLDSRSRNLLDKFRKWKVSVVPLSAQTIGQISGTNTSQGLLGLFKIHKFDLQKLYRPKCKILLLDNISDPGNAGTLIRSSAAFGFDFAVVTNYSVEPYNPKVVRSSAGAVFAIPIVVIDIDSLIDFKVEHEIPMITADIRGLKLEKVFKSFGINRGLILAVGSEATGISKRLGQMADLKVRIDHNRKIDSLNAAVAGSIIMKEVYEL